MDKEKIYHFLITPGMPIIIIFYECGNIRGVDVEAIRQGECNAARRCRRRALFCQNLCPLLFTPLNIFGAGV